MQCIEFKKLVKKRSTSKVFHRLNMDMMFEAYLTHESGNIEEDDIPHSDEPVWILGKKYNALKDADYIRQDIRSRLWFTYRKGFVSIGDSGLTSDKGWGCMLRCGQMLLAQALMFLRLGRDWVWKIGTTEIEYFNILRRFEDRRSAPYSIHQIALTGASEGKQVGDWFGPNTVAQVLKKLAIYDNKSSLVIHVALDNTIIVNDIKRLCHKEDEKSKSRSWKPLVLIVPLRLGINEINPVYIKALKICFTFSQSLGVIGGRPNHALYFIGTIGEDVIFLDPHTTQSIGLIDSREEDSEKKTDSSYHCQRASRLHILHMDPSVALGFLCKTEKEFDQLCLSIKENIMPEKQALFEVRQERERQWTPVGEQAEEAATALMTEKKGRGYRYFDGGVLDAKEMEITSRVGWDRHFDDSDEDFELLG